MEGLTSTFFFYKALMPDISGHTVGFDYKCAGLRAYYALSNRGFGVGFDGSRTRGCQD